MSCIKGDDAYWGFENRQNKKAALSDCFITLFHLCICINLQWFTLLGKVKLH